MRGVYQSKQLDGAFTKVNLTGLRELIDKVTTKRTHNEERSEEYFYLSVYGVNDVSHFAVIYQA